MYKEITMHIDDKLMVQLPWGEFTRDAGTNCQLQFLPANEGENFIRVGNVFFRNFYTTYEKTGSNYGKIGIAKSVSSNGVLKEIAHPDDEVGLTVLIVFIVLAVILVGVYILGFSKWKKFDGRRIIKRDRHPYK